MKNFLYACILFAQVSTSASAESAPFSAKNWLDDYNGLRHHLEQTYANLTWFASTQGGVDLPRLHKRTAKALKEARTDSDAKLVIENFIAEFHDGHLSVLPKAITLPEETKVPPPVLSRSVTSAAACAQMGFVHRKGTAFTMPFEAGRGFRLLHSGETDSFRTGIVEMPSGKKLGIVRIAVIRQQEFPSTCERAWKDVIGSKDSGTCDSSCQEEVNARAMSLFLEDLSDRLHELEKLGASGVLLDIGTNGGGNDLGDWIPRLFTAHEVHSPKLGIVNDPGSSKYYDEQLNEIGPVLKEEKSDAARSALNDAQTEFTRLKEVALHGKKCDMSWVWREQRPWSPLTSSCTNLIFGKSYFSGAFDYLKKGTLNSPKAEKALYWATEAAPYLGSWKGPVYVLVDHSTGSAAEATAAIFQNNRAAKLVGVKTGGSGCGFMYDDKEFALPHSGLRIRTPNCVRLRDDGTDEVAGMRPEIEVKIYANESDQQRALRALALISADLVTSTAKQDRD